jgi:LuxR family maltose regulon positive regulatory protein
VAHTLGGEDPETQRFLLSTSVLGRFSADLCRAVTERPDAGRLLRRADEANLFLVALDDDRSWFRYQRLFAELLRAELDRRFPTAARPLRRRAAAWFAARHDSGAAVQQLSAAGDIGEAFSIVSADPYDAGWGHLIGTDWSSVFPAGWVEGSPERMLHFAALLGRNGQLAEATAWLDRAGEALADHPADHPTRGLLLSAQAMWNGVTMHAGRCEELGLAALEAPVPPEAAVFHERVRVLLLGARMLLDDLDGVEDMCRELDVATSSEIMRTLMAPSFRSHRALRRGELRRAEDEARRVLQTAQAMGIPHHPGVRDAQVALAGARAERGDFDEAERLLGLAAAMADNLSWPAYAALYRSELAGVRAGCSGPAAGLDLLAEVRRGLEGEVVGPELHARVDGDEAALRLEAGHLDRVGPLVATMLPGTRRDLLAARLALGLDDLPAARERLAAVTPAHPRDRLGRDLVAASLAAAEGRTDERDRHLLAAGRTGVAEGFATTFLREASPLVPELRRLADGHHELRRLVADVDRVAAHRSRREPTGLSDREAAVLRHLAGAMTHQEIAGELGVSTNTVKSHVRSLYRKLGVQSRAEAVAAARERRR